MKYIYRFFLFITISSLLFSCKDSDDTEEIIIEETPFVFSPQGFFSGTVLGKTLREVNDSTNFSSVNFWTGNSVSDFSTIQFGNSINFDNFSSDQVIISFAKSYHDSSLILNNNRRTYQSYSLQNPFKNSTDFHEMFTLNGQQNFFYSQIHGPDQFADTTYSGLVINLKFNNKWYDSFDNFSTDSRNYYEILKYEAIRENAVISSGDIYSLPYGKVRVKFDCYLKERDGPAIIHLENAEFQGLINEQ